MKILNIVVEPLRFAYEHDKILWFVMSMAYAFFPLTVLYVIVKIRTNDIEWIEVIVGLSMSLAVSTFFINFLLDTIKINFEKKLRREKPCPMCKGRGYR